MFILNVSLHSIDNSGCPFDDEWLQPVLLIQVGVHELFQGLFCQLILLTFLIKFDLLGVNVHDGIFELLLC